MVIVSCCLNLYHRDYVRINAHENRVATKIICHLRSFKFRAFMIWLHAVVVEVCLDVKMVFYWLIFGGTTKRFGVCFVVIIFFFVICSKVFLSIHSLREIVWYILILYIHAYLYFFEYSVYL